MEAVIDIRSALAVLGQGWAFGGSVTDGTEACWDEVVWEDERPKPTWEELQAAHVVAVVRYASARFAAIVDASFGHEMEEITNYPINERETWPFLVEECRAYQASSGVTVGTMLAAYEQNIGVLMDGTTPADTLPAFVSAVLSNYQNWAGPSGVLIARRRTLSKQFAEILAGMSATPPTYTRADLEAFIAAATLDG